MTDPARCEDVVAAHAAFFDAAEPVSIARAPGRLDLMGGIADYSGSLVLQLPLAAAACAAGQWCDAPEVTVRSVDAPAGARAEVRVPLAELTRDYADVRRALAADPERHWAAYVAGAVTVLARERGVRFERGLRLLLASEVPAGKGVSSSAAIEVAAMHALAGLAGLALPGRDLALLCQTVENRVVGAPCGVMDQMTAACGEKDALLALRCQPAEIEPSVRLPDGVAVYGIDSGIRHAVSGADYGSVRAGAFMGYRIVAALAGLPVSATPDGVRIEDPRWHGYLANVTPAEWEADFRDRVPETLTGAEFLAAYGGSTDPVTSIDPARRYAVRQPAAHPIYEHDRVRRFRDLLQTGRDDDATLGELGRLMYASHASYGACGLGSSGTDALVRLVCDAGPSRGLFGAKITGGGSGGTVAVLARAGRRDAVEAVAASYARATGMRPAILSGSSDGAIRSGLHRGRFPRGR